MKLNGYRPSHKNKWLFIQHGILTLQELSLLEYYADIMVFDESKSNFCTFEVDFKKQAEIFHCSSNNTVRNWHNRLLQIGFIKKVDETFYETVCPLRYISSSPKWHGKSDYYAEIEKDQPIEIILQNFGIDFQSIGKKSQKIGIGSQEKTVVTTNSHAIPLSSSKDDLYNVNQRRKKVIIKQEPRSETEYQRIYEENNYQELKPEDMRWIDENLKEEVIIESDEMEKKVVEIYFDGDWEKYQRGLTWG